MIFHRLRSMVEPPREIGQLLVTLMRRDFISRKKIPKICTPAKNDLGQDRPDSRTLRPVSTQQGRPELHGYLLPRRQTRAMVPQKFPPLGFRDPRSTL
jgi:hypothetical protein